MMSFARAVYNSVNLIAFGSHGPPMASFLHRRCACPPTAPHTHTHTHTHTSYGFLCPWCRPPSASQQQPPLGLSLFDADLREEEDRFLIQHTRCQQLGRRHIHFLLVVFFFFFYGFFFPGPRIHFPFLFPFGSAEPVLCVIASS